MWRYVYAVCIACVDHAALYFLPEQSLYLTGFLSIKKWGAGYFFSSWDFWTGCPQQSCVSSVSAANPYNIT